MSELSLHRAQPEEFLNVLAGTQDHERNVPFEYSRMARLTAHLWLRPFTWSPWPETALSSSRVIAPKHFWKFQLSLQGSNPVSGTFGAIEVNDEWKWMGNVMCITFSLGQAVRSIGGRRQVADVGNVITLAGA